LKARKRIIAARAAVVPLGFFNLVPLASRLSGRIAYRKRKRF
jgi:hypothetical protein